MAQSQGNLIIYAPNNAAGDCCSVDAQWMLSGPVSGCLVPNCAPHSISGCGEIGGIINLLFKAAASVRPPVARPEIEIDTDVELLTGNMHDALICLDFCFDSLLSSNVPEKVFILILLLCNPIYL